MIILTVKASPVKEHKQDFINAFHKIVDTVYQEEGCIEYKLHQNTKDENQLFIYERWESLDAQKQHMATPHMVQFFKEIKPWFSSEIEMKFYESTER